MTEPDAAKSQQDGGEIGTDQRWHGRFTPADGVRGWHQARIRNSPVYGAGAVVLNGSIATLQGWQRTWLGVPTETATHVAYPHIRNVVREGALVHLEVKLSRRWRMVDFAAVDESAADRLVSALPSAQSTGFAEAWHASRIFQQQVQGLPGRAWVTPALVALNVSAFVISCVLSGGLILDPYELMRLGANSGLLTTQGEWWRLLTATFLHLGLVHLAFNIWALWHAGHLTERLFGSGPYLTIYLVAGVLASLTSTVWNPMVMSAGASGAIFGVLGALLAFVLRGHGLPQTIVRAHRLSTILFIGFNLVLGALSPGIDNAAHVGGLLSGFVLGLILARPLVKREESPLGVQSLATVCAFVAVPLIAGIAYIGAKTAATGPAPSGWLRENGWYANEEGSVIRAESALGNQWQAGLISPKQYSEGLRSEVLPFYVNAETRLSQAAVGRAAGLERNYGELILNYVGRRHEWLQSIAENADGADAGAAKRTAALSRQVDQAQAAINLAQLREQLNGRPLGLRSELLAHWRVQRANRSFSCSSPPEIQHSVAVRSDAPGDGPAQRRTIGCEAQRRLLLADYAFLEQELHSRWSRLNDLADGTSSYSGIVDGLDDLFEFGPVGPDQLFIALAEWRRAYPDSVYPSLFEAIVFRNWAWSSRGGGVANSVNAQQWQLFRVRMDMALAVLDEIGPRASSHPLWYQVSIHTALDQSRPLEEIRELYQHGIALNRAYAPLHNAMLRVLLPRWLGSTSEAVEFIDRASLNGSNADYAKLFWTYARLEHDNDELFEEGGISWARVRGGFARLLRDHPASDYWLNAYAIYACRKQDREEYQRIRVELGTRISSTAWPPSLSLADCDKRFNAAKGESGNIAKIRGDGLPSALDANATSESVLRQVAAALAAAEPLRVAITHYVEEHGGLPSDEMLRMESRFAVVNPVGATVSPGLGASINMRLNGGPLDGRKFSWTPTELQGSLKWWCAQEDVPEEFLGPPCR